jgi:hypothetical protein
VTTSSKRYGGRTDAAVFPWTPELRDAAIAMRDAGNPLSQIAVEITARAGVRCHEYQVRHVLQDEITREARLARMRARRMREAAAVVEETNDPIYDPSRDPAPVWETRGAFLMGDPPIGRRAIDARAAA